MVSGYAFLGALACEAMSEVEMTKVEHNFFTLKALILHTLCTILQNCCLFYATSGFHAALITLLVASLHNLATFIVTGGEHIVFTNPKLLGDLSPLWAIVFSVVLPFAALRYCQVQAKKLRGHGDLLCEQKVEFSGKKQ